MIEKLKLKKLNETFWVIFKQCETYFFCIFKSKADFDVHVGLQVYLRGQLFLDIDACSSDAKPDVKSCLTCFSQRRPWKPGAHWQSMYLED